MLPHLAGAAAGERGHPLYVSPIQGAGRADNPAHYRVFYASDSAAGAVAEAFGTHGLWSDHLLRGRPDLPGSVTAVAVYDATGTQALDLDDARNLVQRRLRPSEVVTRDRAVTQRWALEIFRAGRWGGVRWWSYYDSRWGSYALWDVSGLRPVEVRALTREDPAVVQAGAVLVRPWMPVR